MEVVKELFNALESNHPEVVEDTKKKFHEHFNSTKESWLLNGMFDYYLNTGSVRTVEILVGVREPHEKFLFDRLSESIRGAQRLQALTLLSHVVCRHPTWLYKIVNHPLLKDLLKLLKIETEIIPLMSALLIVIVLLPIIAGLFGPHLQDIFEVFSRLAAWNTNNPNKVPEGHLVHLQVGLYALFNRLYGMYPCNFLAFLRQQYHKENQPIFSHTIKPMLDTVRMHPLLVKGSKESEIAAARWKKMEANDVIIECAKFSLESGERCRDDCGFRGRTPSLRSRSSLEYSGGLIDGCKLGGKEQGGVASYSMNLPDSEEVWSPSLSCGAPTPPESAPTSIPHTPISQTYAVSSSFPQQEGTSPPEAAVEATPESTPVKDVRQSIVRAAPGASTVARALNSFAAVQQSGSTQSQPSSPMRKETSPFRFPPAATTPPASAFQAAPPTSVAAQKVHRVILDRIQVEKEKELSGVGVRRPKTPGSGERYDHRGYQPSSPLRVISMGPDSHWDSLPNSPLQVDHTDEDKEVETTMRLDNPPNPSPALTFRRLESDTGGVGVNNEMEAEFEDCTVKGCIEGGLHMPDTRSMMQFTQQVRRLRFFSQCAPDTFQLNNIGVSSGSSPREGCGFLDMKVRRAVSCPEMKKTSSMSNTMSDLLGVSALDETVEEEAEDTTTLNGHINMADESAEYKRLVSSFTQTDELQPLEYEHLFLSVFPSLGEQQTHSAPPDVQSAPLFSPYSIRFSPHTALENYVDTAVKSLNEKIQRHQGGDGELKGCRDQIMLLTLQLQYERHRREVHAERNRRLLGKSRNNRALEEHNSALRDQVTLLQKVIETLRNELERTKIDTEVKLNQVQESVLYWQDQTNSLQRDIKEAKSQISLLEQELKDAKQTNDKLSKELQSSQATVFELEKCLESTEAEATVGRNVKAELTALQHRVAIAGEVEARLRSRLTSLQLTASGAATELHGAVQAYNRHVAGLQNNVESRRTYLDAAKARFSEAEAALEKKDKIIYEQKLLLRSVKEEYDHQIKALEQKMEELRRMKTRQDEESLELLQRIEMLENSGKKSCVASQAGSPPLSTSLSSSGTLSLSDPPQIRNLQNLVDIPEPSTCSRDPQPPPPV